MSDPPETALLTWLEEHLRLSELIENSLDLADRLELRDVGISLDRARVCLAPIQVRPDRTAPAPTLVALE